MNIQEAQSQEEWNAFLLQSKHSPFLQSWTMGTVYEEILQTPVRLEARGNNGKITGICLGIVVPARRGKHIAVQYGPITESDSVACELLEECCKRAKELG